MHFFARTGPGRNGQMEAHGSMLLPGLDNAFGALHYVCDALPGCVCLVLALHFLHRLSAALSSPYLAVCELFNIHSQTSDVAPLGI